MDSPDIDSNETVQHQSTIEQVVAENVQPQLQPSGNANESIIAPEIVPDKTSDEPALSSRTCSVAGDQTKPLPTEETVDHEPKIGLEKEEDKRPVSTQDSTVLSLLAQEKPEDSSSEPSSSSSITSSTTTIAEEVKQMSRRQLATVLILCFVNLLKYMDRFTIAGTAVCKNDTHIYLVLLYSHIGYLLTPIIPSSRFAIDFLTISYINQQLWTS